MLEFLPLFVVSAFLSLVGMTWLWEKGFNAAGWWAIVLMALFVLLFALAGRAGDFLAPLFLYPGGGALTGAVASLVLAMTRRQK